MATPRSRSLRGPQNATVSVPGRAKSSPDTRIPCTASHIACTIRDDRQHRNISHFQKENETHWHVLSWRSPDRGRHWIFRRRQKRHASFARKTGRLRPNMGKVKADSSALLLSLEFEDATGTPVEDDGRDDSDESGLDTAEWSSLLDPGSAGWSCARE